MSSQMQEVAQFFSRAPIIAVSIQDRVVRIHTARRAIRPIRIATATDAQVVTVISTILSCFRGVSPNAQLVKRQMDFIVNLTPISALTDIGENYPCQLALCRRGRLHRPLLRLQRCCTYLLTNNT